MRYKNDKKNIKFVIIRFVFFKLKIHQNPFSAGAPPGPRWGSFRRSPRPPSRLGRGIPGGFPLPLPILVPARRLRRLELGAFGASVFRPHSTQNPGYASAANRANEIFPASERQYVHLLASEAKRAKFKMGRDFFVLQCFRIE